MEREFLSALVPSSYPLYYWKAGQLWWIFSVHGSSASLHSDFSLIRLYVHPCFLSGTAAFFLGFRGEAESCAHLN